MGVRIVQIGVRDLQQRLSFILDRASKGDLVRVTSRGRAKALILPPSAEPLVAIMWDKIRDEARAEQGIREGWIRPRVIDEMPEIPEHGSKGKITTAEALGADRDE
ncbi:MAG: type II toxin-antitoxin system Phd/YefM family antitoxin [Gaiellaceae bacterium]